MTHLDPKLVALGAFIDSTRCKMHIPQSMLCADIGCSKGTYQLV